MRPVVTPAQMAEADRRVIASGTPEPVLVDRAGRAVARAARQMLGGVYGRRVVVAAGKGNNGADGRVAADALRARGVGVDLFPIDEPLDRAAFTRAVGRAHLFVDAMFGTGFRGALGGDAAWVAAAVHDAEIAVLAIDIPSGVDGATGLVAEGADAVHANATLTFAARKPGLLFEPGRSHAGRLIVAEIGIDPALGTGDAPALGVTELGDLRLPERGPNQHKWSSGLFVFGGSNGLTGAPMMAAHAAARAGAGMVVCGLPGAETAAAASGSEIVTRAFAATDAGGFDEDAARVALKDLARFRGAAIGPGLGRDDRAQAAARRLVAEAPLPIVVDADALNALAVDASPLRVRHAASLPPAILTPHAGEYERLAGHAVGADRVAAARELAARTNAIVLLKGPGTVVARPNGDAAVNTTDIPALGTAGTGDVLTGIIGGLLANGADPFTAAITGAYVHGRAAWAAGTAPDLVAIDLIGALHPTLDALRSGRDPWED
jgi:NAD(P)H-hydrate epimerase